MQLGIVGMPFVGKTTLFNALTKAHAETGAYGGSSKDANHAVVKVDDPRLWQLAEKFHPKKVTPATVEYMDMAGLTSGSIDKGGVPASFLATLRTVDALVHVVRAFEDDSIPHVYDRLDPKRDAEALELEFTLADLQIVENRLERLAKELRTGKVPLRVKERDALERCRAELTNGNPLRDLPFDEEETRLLKGFRFLTQKPLMLVVNIGENDVGSDAARSAFADWRDKSQMELLAVCAEMEMELAQLSDEEAAAFRADLNVGEPALTQMVRASYALLGQLTFFTCGEQEVRAWTIPAGSTAVDAAGAIHTDLARGFIRAETVFWEDMVKHGSYAKVKEAGLFRLEGKEYPVKDGDTLLIRFNV